MMSVALPPINNAILYPLYKVRSYIKWVKRHFYAISMFDLITMLPVIKIYEET